MGGLGVCMTNECLAIGLPRFGIIQEGQEACIQFEPLLAQVRGLSQVARELCRMVQG
jgi:hypothetical protein